MGNTYNLIIIRHGITAASKNKVHYGSGTDIPLLPEGVEELKALKAQGIYPDPEGKILVSSGMIRANETLQILFGKRDFEVVSDLKEVNLGEFEMKGDEIQKHPAYKTWHEEQRYKFPPPGGESIFQMRDRVFQAIRELFERHKENISGADTKDFIIVCHLGPTCAIMHFMFPGIRDDFFAWTIDPGHGYIIEMDGTQAISYRTF
jgi:broad specificity phosphatase PhoE